MLVVCAPDHVVVAVRLAGFYLQKKLKEKRNEFSLSWFAFLWLSLLTTGLAPSRLKVMSQPSHKSPAESLRARGLPTRLRAYYNIL